MKTLENWPIIILNHWSQANKSGLGANIENLI